MADSREPCNIFIKLFLGKQQLLLCVEARVVIFLHYEKKMGENKSIL